MNENIPYLTIPGNHNPIEIIELSEDQYQKIKLASEKIHEYLYYKRRLDEIHFNRNEYFDTIDSFIKTFQKSATTSIQYDFKELGFISINRCLNNFLASLNSLIEHCERKIVNLFTKDSEQFREFKKFESGLYDEYFSYRFLKNLRNYTIHANYGLEYVKFFNRNLDKFGHDVSYELEALCDREKLLSNRVLAKKLGDEIKNLPSHFEIGDYIKEVDDLIIQVLKKFIELARVEIIDSARLLNDLSTKFNQKDLSITKMKIVRFDFKYSSKILPISLTNDLIDLIGDQKK